MDGFRAQRHESRQDRTAAQRWGTTIGLAFVSLIAAGTLGFAAMIVGSGFMASDSARPGPSAVLWVLAGASLSVPVAALPALGFSVRRRTAVLAAISIVVVVVLLGSFGLNQP